MKITVINGQNHKGSTYNMGKILADKLSDDATEIFLPLDFGGRHKYVFFHSKYRSRM